jgi:hypothetical protein
MGFGHVCYRKGDGNSSETDAVINDFAHRKTSCPVARTAQAVLVKCGALRCKKWQGGACAAEGIGRGGASKEQTKRPPLDQAETFHTLLVHG